MAFKTLLERVAKPNESLVSFAPTRPFIVPLTE
jgi:hypothetical protein